MSELTQNSVRLSAEFHGFDGVDTRKKHSGEPSTADMTNFRIRSDGSMEKRCGFRRLLSLPEDIRAFWRGYMDSELLTFALAGSHVYVLWPEKGTYYRLATIGSSTGSADFFFYQNLLYLVDGVLIYKLTKHTLEIVSGYVPHVAKDRACAVEGEQNESLNHLNREARLTFLAGEDPRNYLMVNREVDQVRAVYRNGVKLEESQYTYSDLLRAFTLDQIRWGDRITVCLSYKERSDTLPDLLSATNATVFGGISNSRVFLWGDNGSMMYASSFVPRDELQLSKTYYPQSDPLFFPEHHEFFVGDGQYKIRAVVRHYDRLLIFTEGDVWMADSSSSGLETFPVMNINTSATCAVKDGATLLGNDPISVGKHTVFRWTTETDERNECNAYSISLPIDSELDEDFYSSAVLYADGERGELWFHGKDEAGTVWIYSSERNAWFRFTGIHADRFFPFERQVGFTKGGDLFCFDPTLTHDEPEEGVQRPIVATFQSGLLHFGSGDRKRLCSFSILADNAEQPPTVRIGADGIGDVVFPVNLHRTHVPDADGHVCRQKRLHAGRFRYASLTLTDDSDQPLLIHELSLSAQSYHKKGAL